MISGVISLPAERQKGEIRPINEPPNAVLVPSTFGFGTGLVFADASSTHQPPAK
jgi:hypothetical protein